MLSDSNSLIEKIMKKQLIKIFTVALSLFFAGCLEDDRNPLDPSGSSNVVEFLDIASPSSPQTAPHPLWVSAFSVAPSAEFMITLSFSGPNSNGSDIDVTLEVDPLMIDAYNDAIGTSYEVLDPSLYSIASMTVTIPKGKTKVQIPITVFPDLFDLSINYALPLRIVSTSSGVISKNFGSALFGTVVKNKYDGVYAVDGNMFDALGGFSDGFYPTEVELITVDGVTNRRFDTQLGSNLHGIIQVGTGSLFVFGNFSIQFEFDGAVGSPNAVVDAYNTQPPGGNNRYGKLGVGVNQMTFDGDGIPIEMEVQYIMIQNGTDRATFTETWTYLRPRD
jgi:hypothetical protein